MSSVYMTETEQIEILKKWWKKYNQIVLITISIALLVISGLRYWHWHREKISEQASNAYEHLMVAFSNQDDKSVRSYAHQLMTHYAGTVYADTARLL
ncbi:MAG TPA: tetratricopeptide repeat protein, partial [Legionellaceae bacterium]|nr:tetratricopeptide repeat protein [Legionellaceae bacterium]